MTEDDNVYIVVEDEFRNAFEEKVNELLLKGCLPLGGVSTYVDKDGYVHYCQALLKPSSIKS
ncbi:MAG: DUF1737 domain-containing protein [Alphaproteobacteria bacterium]|nr:DUF1737 domain-containing protein [Alphaproteobacteria bacterium]MBR1600229.1 DUF1737 domain-containing protein [Alphaproteobacteria bacterium]